MEHRPLAFGRLVVLGCVSVAAVVACAICLIESHAGTGWAFTDIFFLTVSSVASTGLSTFDPRNLMVSSQIILVLCMQLCGTTFITLIPVVLRRRALEKLLPSGASREIDQYRRVPAWLVEYKALSALIRIVVLFHLCSYVFWGAFIYVGLSSQPDASAQEVNPLVATISMVIAAFNNAGINLSVEDLSKLRNDADDAPVFIGMCMLSLSGNVLYPLLLRWIVIFLNWRAEESSNAKVVYRFLLLHARSTCVTSG